MVLLKRAKHYSENLSKGARGISWVTGISEYLWKICGAFVDLVKAQNPMHQTIH